MGDEPLAKMAKLSKMDKRAKELKDSDNTDHVAEITQLKEKIARHAQSFDIKTLLTVHSSWKTRRYGRVAHFLPLPTWGHDVPWAIVIQTVDMFQTPGCLMKDMDIIFP